LEDPGTFSSPILGGKPASCGPSTWQTLPFCPTPTCQPSQKGGVFALKMIILKFVKHTKNEKLETPSRQNPALVDQDFPCCIIFIPTRKGSTIT